AVRADQSMDGPALDAQADAVDGDKSGKFLGEILGFEDDVATHTGPLPQHCRPIAAIVQTRCGQSRRRGFAMVVRGYALKPTLNIRPQYQLNSAGVSGN